jgi:hypothetical protein
MANINTTKNAVEIRSELRANGTTVEYIVVNNQKIGILGYANEKDKQKAIKTIETALAASNGNIYEMMCKLNTIATIEEEGIEPDKMIKIGDEEIIISYSQRAAYTIDGVKIADCDDLPAMPNEAIEAVLVARVEKIIEE